MAVTAAVHLLFLVAFSWMLVEGLLLWSKVVTVSLRPGPGMMLHYATGWGEAPCSPLLLCSHLGPA